MRNFTLTRADGVVVDAGENEPVFHDERQGWVYGNEVLTDPAQQYVVTFTDAPDPPTVEAYTWGPIDWLNQRWLIQEKAAVRKLGDTDLLIAEFLRELDDPRTAIVRTDLPGIQGGVAYIGGQAIPAGIQMPDGRTTVLTAARIAAILAPKP